MKWYRKVTFTNNRMLFKCWVWKKEQKEGCFMVLLRNLDVRNNVTISYCIKKFKISCAAMTTLSLTSPQRPNWVPLLWPNTHPPSRRGLAGQPHVFYWVLSLLDFTSLEIHRISRIILSHPLSETTENLHIASHSLCWLTLLSSATPWGVALWYTPPNDSESVTNKLLWTHQSSAGCHVFSQVS